MLDNRQLNTTDFDDLYEHNIEVLHKQLPSIDMTRRSEPLVTIIEILTLLSDIQNFNINRVTKAHIEKYVSLLGAEKSTFQPAKIQTLISTNQEQEIAPGTRFYAGEEESPIVYETIHSHYMIDNKISTRFLQEKQKDSLKRYYQKQQIIIQNKQQYLYILFEKGLSTKTNTIYFTINSGNRNQRDASGYQEARIQVEYYCEYGWQKAIHVIDQTNGLLYTGSLSFTALFKSTQCVLDTKVGYGIRVCIQEAKYDQLPIIEDININPMSLVQTKTYIHQREVNVCGKQIFYQHYLERYGKLMVLKKQCHHWIDITMQCTKTLECIELMEDSNEQTLLLISYDIQLLKEQLCFDSIGVASQRITLPVEHVIKESIALMMQEDKGYRLYHQYTYDYENNQIVFGNGKDHPILPRKKEAILLVSLQTSLNSAGNIRSNTLYSDNKTIIAMQQKESIPSKEEETIDQRIALVKKQYNTTDTILQKYRNIALTTPFLALKEVKVYLQKDYYHSTKESGIVVIVQKYTHTPLTKQQERLLYTHLKKEVYINTPIEIISIEYLPISIDINVSLFYPKQETLLKIKEVIDVFIKKQEMKVWQLRRNNLYALIKQVSNVKEVEQLDIVNNQEKIVQKDIRGHELVYIEQITVI